MRNLRTKTTEYTCQSTWTTDVCHLRQYSWTLSSVNCNRNSMQVILVHQQLQPTMDDNSDGSISDYDSLDSSSEQSDPEVQRGDNSPRVDEKHPGKMSKYCKPCQSWIGSGQHWKDHLDGKKHKRNTADPLNYIRVATKILTKLTLTRLLNYTIHWSQRVKRINVAERKEHIRL